MLKPLYLLLFVLFSFNILSSQTTDLSIAIEAQNLNGVAISQVDIYEDFQYVITVLNSGNLVENATLSVSFDTDLNITSYSSQNNNAGASEISNINLNNGTINASIASMPNNGSVELLVLVTAPTILGGIATNGSVYPPDNISDTNTSNNQSIISIDVLDLEIDFTVTHTQIEPVEGTAISAWGDTVSYQFTITNNSSINYPITAIEGLLELASPYDNGQPFVQFVSLDCIATTNGTLCPDLSNASGGSTTITSTQSVFNFIQVMEITAGGSITFEMVYRYSNFSCSENPLPIDVYSFIEIELDHANVSFNISNYVNTNLLSVDLCPETDICIETTQTNPDITIDLQYEQEITLVTTVCNVGGVATPMQFFLQNLSFLTWEIVSVNCISTTGSVTCNDFTIINGGPFWTSNDFVLQPDTTITIETVVKYFEPDCYSSSNPIQAVIRSGTNILDTQLVDSNINNNYYANILTFPGVEVCETSDLHVTKTQVSPQLPIGSSIDNTTEWGLITYEITVTNDGNENAFIEVQDFMEMPDTNEAPIFAMLNAVECISTTGTASCFTIENTNIGVLFDGVSENGELDTFWQILPEDNWELPAHSSVSFSVTVNWLPECSTNPMVGTNVVSANYVSDIIETNHNNNTAEVKTYFAPCIDLVVQTYPEFTQVNTNQTFNWIIDISNSTTSSSATDVLFEDSLNDVFDIIGTPVCYVTSGSASCITNFNVTGNFISGIIPNMEAGSTVTISIPVTAPSFGGAYNNIAEAIPSAANNEELTPETNISINSVQVIAPVLQKSFMPNTIIEGGESELTFTVLNIASNPSQTNISFTDNLPNGVVLSSIADWVLSNGCTASFTGNAGDNFVGVENLVFPAGVESCTFSVMVTSNDVGTYLNNFQNFTNDNNIDTSQTSATLSVIVDTSNVDIEILKSVVPTEAAFGETVDFTITATNLGSTEATLIEIIDVLPQGYQYVSATPSFGVFNDTTLTWNLTSLNANASETLILTAIVVSSNNLTNTAILNSVNEPDRNAFNNEDNAIVEVSNCLNIPEGISPNKDQKNDVLIIPCIEDYPENTLKIFNRYGTQIYEASSYLNTWDGRANMGFPRSSELLPVGTYYYVLEIQGFSKPKLGYVYLNY